MVISVGLSSCSHQGGCPLGAVLDISQALLCLCRSRTLRTWAEALDPDPAEHFHLCGNPWEVTARSKSQRSYYWTCRCTWILDASNKTSSTKGHSLARDVQAQPVEVVTGDSVVPSELSWCLPLSCTEPAVLPQETSWKLAWQSILSMCRIKCCCT